MRYLSARRIRPGLELLDRRDIPSNFLGIAVTAQVAPVPTTTTYVAVGTLSSTQHYGETYQAAAFVTQTSSSFTAKVLVFEPQYNTVEHYTVSGPVSPSGQFSGSGSGTDGTLTVSHGQISQGPALKTITFDWTITVPPDSTTFDQGTGVLYAAVNLHQEKA